MTWRIAAVAFLLCFALNSGKLIAADETPPEDNKPTGEQPPERPSPPSSTHVEEQAKKKERERKESEAKAAEEAYLERHFPLSKADAEFFRNEIVQGGERAGRALGELMGSIYKAEKKKILEDAETDPDAATYSCSKAKEGQDYDFKELEKHKFFRYLCSAAFKDKDNNLKAPWMKGEEEEAFKKAFETAREAKESANQFYTAKMNEIKEIEEKLKKETKPEEIKKLKDARAAAIAALTDKSKFSPDDIKNFAHSYYSKKAALGDSDLDKSQATAATAALRAQAQVTEDNKLIDTIEVDNQKYNVQVGALGADDGKFSNWAMQAIARKDMGDGNKLTQKGQKVKPVAYDKGGTPMGPAPIDGQQGKFQLADKYEAPKSIEPVKVEPKQETSTELAAFDGSKLSATLSASKCTECHGKMTVGADGALTSELLNGGKPVSRKDMLAKIRKQNNDPMKAVFAETPDAKAAGMSADELEEFRKWVGIVRAPVKK